MANPIPSLILPFVIDITAPARVGPLAQPRSPANARRANIKVPPFFIPEEAILKVPGQKIPTEKPAKPQARRVIVEFGTKMIIE